MSAPLVFFDIDTQIDFLFPSGALYVPGAEDVLPAIARLNQFAASRGFPVVSTTCAHGEDDPEFRRWPAHCVTGTTGQLKPAATLLSNRATIGAEPCAIAIDGAQQVILEKRELSLFSNPNLAAVIERLGAEEYVVYGVVTEYC